VNLLLEWWALRKYAATLEPSRADANGLSASATLPYCKPFTEYNPIGYHVGFPYGLDLRWDGGENLEYKLRGVDKSEIIASLRGEEGQGGSFRFLDCHTDFGSLLVQLWTGVVLRTPPGTATIVLPSVNESRDRLDPVVQAGVIETDWFRGEVHLNLNLRLQGQNVSLKPYAPLAKLLVVPAVVIEANKEKPLFLKSESLRADLLSWQAAKSAYRRTAYKLKSTHNKESPE
jgi:hypothetical protein